MKYAILGNVEVLSMNQSKTDFVAYLPKIVIKKGEFIEGKKVDINGDIFIKIGDNKYIHFSFVTPIVTGIKGEGMLEDSSSAEGGLLDIKNAPKTLVLLPIAGMATGLFIAHKRNPEILGYLGWAALIGFATSIPYFIWKHKNN